MGNGYFFTQEDIEDKIIDNIGELIYCIPGMVYCPAQMDGYGFMEPKICSVRYLADGILANIYLNGMRVDNDYIDLIPSDQIMAVEVYKSSMYAPAQYGGGWRPGGVILIWTKH